LQLGGDIILEHLHSARELLTHVSRNDIYPTQFPQFFGAATTNALLR
jgi:hypothetical protein